MKNLDQKPQTVIAVQGTKLYYSEALPQQTLSPGMYRIETVRVGGEYLPAFQPLDVSNDAPLDIDSKVTEIVNEIDDFFGRQAVFHKMGFSHKRGYMLHGPPGCGKSSTLRLLERHFVDKFEGIVLFWGPGINISGYVEHIRSHEANRPIFVVCEDIDNSISYFEEEILEFLDGQKALNNFVLVATTNNLAAIPSRIKDRPSRIDRVLEIGLPGTETRYKYLRQVGVTESQARLLAEGTPGLSIAHLKEIIVATVCLGRPLDEVLKRLKVADMRPFDVTIDGDDDGDDPEEG